MSLILTVKIGRAVLLGKNFEINIKLMEVKKGEARIAFEAPPEVPILRKEVWERDKKILLSKKTKLFLNKSISILSEDKQ